MTDNEIIKALECVSGKIMSCRNCPYAARYPMSKCREQCAKDALDLINRQQQEIRQLRIKLDDCERDIIPKLKYSLERANKYGAETDTENIRLLKENENLTSANENLTSDLTSAKAKIERLEGCVKSEEEAREIMKSQMTPIIQELIKEQIDRATKIGELKGIVDLTERLCEGRVSNDPVVIAVKFELKEMTGEQ